MKESFLAQYVSGDFSRFFLCHGHETLFRAVKVRKIEDKKSSFIGLLFPDLASSLFFSIPLGPPDRVDVPLCVCVCERVCVCVSACLFTCLSVRPSVCLSVCL